MEIAVNSQPLQWANELARIAVIRDISDFKNLEEQIRNFRERYRTVIDNTYDLVCCFDRDLKISFANHTFRDYFDMEYTELVGSSFLEFMPPSDHQAFTEYMKNISIEMPVRRAIHRVIHSGEIRAVDWIDRAVFDDNGAFVEFQSVGRDVNSYLKSKAKVVDISSGGATS